MAWNIVVNSLWDTVCVFAAGMSEDSDYTSDINYPLQHQHNSSAHQFRSEHPYRSHREDSRDSQQTQGSQEYYSTREYYQDSFDRSASFDQDPQEHYQNPDHYDRGYDQREQDYYSAYPENSYHTGRSDTDSEPLYYNSRPNSRPQSFPNDRWVPRFALTFGLPFLSPFLLLHVVYSTLPVKVCKWKKVVLRVLCSTGESFGDHTVFKLYFRTQGRRIRIL